MPSWRPRTRVSRQQYPARESPPADRCRRLDPRRLAGRPCGLAARECSPRNFSPGLRPALPRVPHSTPPPKERPMAVKTIEDLFIHELSDIYSAEKQLTKALPRLAKAADAPELKTAFETHLEETQGQIERIDQVVEVLGIRLKRIKCAAMEGLVEEGKDVIESVDAGPLRDAALIGGAQKVEHYEIAAY